MAVASEIRSFVPDHVPVELVRTISLYDDPRLETDPFGMLLTLHDGPALVWNTINPRHGSSWVVTRAAEIRHIMENPELFSCKGQFTMARLIGEGWDMVPGELDPPDLRKYREVVSKWLNPKAVKVMEGLVRQRAVTLIDKLEGASGCEFMSAFGIPFPVSIFLDLMGLPNEEADQFLAWEVDIVRNSDMVVRGKAIKAIADYLRERIAERRAQPTDDLLSQAILAEVDGEPLTDERIMGICFMLFTGGLDTVASSIGFQFRYLADHPELQERIRRDPTLIRAVVEELLRAYSVVVVHRVAAEDTELAGVQIKKGDWIAIPTALASMDPANAHGAQGVDPDRKVFRHFAFGIGGHNCLGMHLARLELNVAIEEWSRRMPLFTIAESETATYRGGGVFLVDRLPLHWGGSAR